MRAVAEKMVSRHFCQMSPPRWPIFPQNTKLDMRLPMLKMHKWQEAVAKMSMHYALCNFGYERTGRAPFPPGPDAFSDLCIITIYIITISTVLRASVDRQYNYTVTRWHVSVNIITKSAVEQSRVQPLQPLSFHHTLHV